MPNIIPTLSVFKIKDGNCNTHDNILFINNNDDVNDEKYQIEITRDLIQISGSEKGLFYGSKTLEMLRIIYSDKIPCCTIIDKPTFRYRGFMIDSARHMQSIQELKKIIDIASLLKFNKFHWHLSDDQGYRIESETFPLLNQKGSIRKNDRFGKFCNSDNEYKGYYTKNEIRDIITYCKERYIDVIPEIDFPGHTSAILHSFPELSCRKTDVDVKCTNGIFKDILCAGKTETSDFLKKLFDEICDIFPGEYIHIGGDEAPKHNWKRCPDCKKKLKELSLDNYDQLQIWLCTEVKDYLSQKHKKCIVWNDILKGGNTDKDFIIQRWMDRKHHSSKAAQNGSRIILSNFYPYYLDYPYGQHSLKDIYKFDPFKEFSSSLSNIEGTEAPIWTEFINNNNRLEYLLLPRLFAVAETSWNGNKKTDYKSFKKSCVILSSFLKRKGYNTAQEKYWDMNLLYRLWDILKFYYKFI